MQPEAVTSPVTRHCVKHEVDPLIRYVLESIRSGSRTKTSTVGVPFSGKSGRPAIATVHRAKKKLR